MCFDGNFLMQMIEELMRRGILLYLRLANKEELVHDVKAVQLLLQ